jgi:hypothetical protein
MTGFLNVVNGAEQGQRLWLQPLNQNPILVSLDPGGGGGGVSSFNGRTGVVLPAGGDYLASQVLNNSGIPFASTVADALDVLQAEIDLLDSSSIANDSSVPGANVTGALDSLSGSIATVSGQVAAILARAQVLWVWSFRNAPAAARFANFASSEAAPNSSEIGTTWQPFIAGTIVAVYQRTATALAVDSCTWFLRKNGADVGGASITLAAGTTSGNVTGLSVNMNGTTDTFGIRVQQSAAEAQANMYSRTTVLYVPA